MSLHASSSTSVDPKGSAPSRRAVHFPFCGWSVLLLLICDWLLFVTNLLSDLRELPTILVSGSLIAGACVGVLESLVVHAPPRSAVLKGFAAAVLVAAPLPLLGTLLAFLAAVWLVTLTLAQRRARQFHHTATH